MKPFIKWAGGKTQLLGIIKENMPTDYDTYFEPFLGGGAVLLDIQPKKAIVNDINSLLIDAYMNILRYPKEVLTEIALLDSVEADKEYYYKLRNEYNEKILAESSDIRVSALLIWLNKHCFNGLYRVNRKGEFNVPYNNRKTGVSVDEENIWALHEYLSSNNVELRVGDFEVACKSAKKGDFVYFDSPYIPESVTASFTSYTKGDFLMEDHERLASLFKDLDSRGVKVMLSNNDVPLVRELYSGYDIKSFSVKRAINRDANKRTGMEVLVRNY